MYYHIELMPCPSQVYIFLNGQPLDTVIACDTAEGWADVIITDKHGRSIQCHDPDSLEPVSARVYGEVTVFEGPVPPAAWGTK